MVFQCKPDSCSEHLGLNNDLLRKVPCTRYAACMIQHAICVIPYERAFPCVFSLSC